MSQICVKFPAVASLSVAEVVQVGRWIAGQKPNAKVRAETVQRYLVSVVPANPDDDRRAA